MILTNIPGKFNKHSQCFNTELEFISEMTSSTNISLQRNCPQMFLFENESTGVHKH